MTVPAITLSDLIEKGGAYAGIAAFLGLAVLVGLYFSQARELKRLREWAGRAPERAREVEERVVAQAEAARQARTAGSGPADVSAPATAGSRGEPSASWRSSHGKGGVVALRPSPDAVLAEAEVLLVTANPMQAVTSSGEGILTLEFQGELLAPGFQFDEAGHVLDGVALVNGLLDAADDPWGVASWWLSQHAALRAVPAEAILDGRRDDVISAASAAGHD